VKRGARGADFSVSALGDVPPSDPRLGGEDDVSVPRLKKAAGVHIEKTAAISSWGQQKTSEKKERLCKLFYQYRRTRGGVRKKGGRDQENRQRKKNKREKGRKTPKTVNAINLNAEASPQRPSSGV